MLDACWPFLLFSSLQVNFVQDGGTKRQEQSCVELLKTFHCVSHKMFSHENVLTMKHKRLEAKTTESSSSRSSVRSGVVRQSGEGVLTWAEKQWKVTRINIGAKRAEVTFATLSILAWDSVHTISRLGFAWSSLNSLGPSLSYLVSSLNSDEFWFDR